MESTLATAHDAELVLKLYDLRREETMRKARHWITVEFNPQTFEEFEIPVKDWGSEHNRWFRQVTSYWEMAIAFVLHGALNADLFLDCNGEPLFIYAKFQPFLTEMRKQNPNFLMRIERLLERYPAARERVEQITRALEARRAEAMAEAAARSEGQTFVWYNYRRGPPAAPVGPGPRR